MAGEQKNILEADIARLHEQIEAKRRELAASGSSEQIHPKELIKEVIARDARQSSPAPAAQEPTAPMPRVVQHQTGSYLDQLDAVSVAKVNGLVQSVAEKGIAWAVRHAESEGPFILDAVHDALADKLYDELKKRKLIG